MNLVSCVLLIITIALYSALFIIMVIRQRYLIHFFRTNFEVFKRALDSYFVFFSAYVIRMLISQLRIDLLTVLFDAVMCVLCALLVFKLFSSVRHVLLEVSIR